MHDMDIQFIKRALEGDKNAFYTLVSSEKRRLYHIAFAYLKNEEDALEAVQETTYRAWMNRKKVRDPKYFSTWLIRVLIHYCIDEQKRNKKVLPLLCEPDQSDYEKYDPSKFDLEIALESLEPKYRHMIILKYYQDMTIKEMAETLERPESTIKTWLYKALKQLRNRMSKGGEFDHV